MISDNLATHMEAAVTTCDEAREALETALEAVEQEGASTEDHLRAIAEALEAWREGQRAFMRLVEESDVADLSTAALLLKTNRGVDATNARRGLPGVPVEGTDQPFDVDLTGRRGGAVTDAAMEYVSPPEE
ncbi:MAG: hypothetical protein ACLFTE_02255 [Salinivenus sp.]